MKLTAKSTTTEVEIDEQESHLVITTKNAGEVRAVSVFIRADGADVAVQVNGAWWEQGPRRTQQPKGKS
jgi:hypothetical protein